LQTDAARGGATFSSGMEAATNYNTWIVEGFAPFIGKAVLEVGVGHGNFAKLLERYGASYVGVDIDPALVENARAANPGNRYLTADVTAPEILEATKGLHFDTVLACNVLEHLSDDGAAVRNLLTLLPRGGHLLIYVPAFTGLYNALDRLAGHHRRYSRESVAALVPPDLGGIVRLDYVNPIGGLGWWLTGVLRPGLSDLDQVNGQIALFDRYIVPLSRLLSPPLAKIFGQSIAAVVRRR